MLVVKKVAKKYHLEPEGKDSFKFLKAGAADSVIFAQGEIMRMSRISSLQEGLEIIKKSFSDYDVVLLEGVREDDIPSVEVYDPSLGKGRKYPVSDILITDSDEESGSRVFKRDDIEGIARYMEENHG